MKPRSASNRVRWKLSSPRFLGQAATGVGRALHATVPQAVALAIVLSGTAVGYRSFCSRSATASFEKGDFVGAIQRLKPWFDAGLLSHDGTKLLAISLSRVEADPHVSAEASIACLTEDHRDGDCALLLAKAYRALGKTDEAHRLLVTLLSQPLPQDPELSAKIRGTLLAAVHTQLGEILEAGSKPDLAELEYFAAAKTAAGELRLPALIQYVRFMIRTHKAQSAVETLPDLKREAGEKSVDAWLAAAEVYDAVSRPEDFREAMTRAEEILEKRADRDYFAHVHSDLFSKLPQTRRLPSSDH